MKENISMRVSEGHVFTWLPFYFKGKFFAIALFNFKTLNFEYSSLKSL
jgi:hypothetical protein